MRTYLDHNATTPLRAEARAAMCAAMDMVGNPSSVHAEGRAAKLLLERARGQIKQLIRHSLGFENFDIAFTSGATEAANAVIAAHKGPISWGPTEHDAIGHAAQRAKASCGSRGGPLDCDPGGQVCWPRTDDPLHLVAVQSANSETGIIQLEETPAAAQRLTDVTQSLGRGRYSSQTPAWAVASAHKLGGPKGVGILIYSEAHPPGTPLLVGGGQERGVRAGTENLIGIAGFGAVAEAATHDLDAGRWEEVTEIRDLMESALEAAATPTILVGKDGARLPNTSCIMTPGWKGETQVMQMDLAGFAISAGSACSSGKVRASAVLRAMGYDDTAASSAIRVSLGLETTRDDVLRFADAWSAKLKKHNARAA
ncbi:MAG: aminotransferase class V-fold PLP-dependent enzyme [Sulfitobacter sp.]